MQLDPLVFWSLGELLLISLFTVLVLILRGLLSRRRDNAAARSLIQHVKDDEERRSGETRQILGQRYGLSGDALDALVKTISREEKRLYQTLINLYLKRDAGSLENLDVAFKGAVGPYRSLEVPQAEEPGVSADDSVTAAGMDDAELERLRNENERLSEELRITMDTMGRMLSEYSSMFSGGDDEALDKEKMIAKFQAEEGTDDVTASAADSGDGKEQAAEALAQVLPETYAAADPVVGSSDGESSIPILPEEPGREPVATAGDEDELMSLDDDLESLQTGEEPPVAQVQV